MDGSQSINVCMAAWFAGIHWSCRQEVLPGMLLPIMRLGEGWRRRGLTCRVRVYLIREIVCFLLKANNLLAIYGPVIYTAPYLSFWCGQTYYEGKWKGVGPWNREFLGLVKWHQAVRGVPFGAKNVKIFRANPLPLAQVMDLHASKALHTGPYQSEVHR